MVAKYKLNEDKDFEIDLPIDQARKEKTNRRVIKVLRTADEAINAAKKAREQGKIKEAEDLEADAEALKAWAEGQYDKAAEIPDPNHFQGGSSSNKDNGSKSPENVLDSQGTPMDDPKSSEENNDSSNEKTGEAQANNNANKTSNAEAGSNELNGNTNQDAGQDNDKPSTSNSNTGAENNSGTTGNENDSSNDDDDLGSEKSTDSEEENNTNYENSESSKKQNNSNNSAAQNNEDAKNNTGTGQSGSSSSNSKQVENPFDLDPKQASKLAGSESSEQTPLQDEDDELERMKQVLNMLRGGEKDGAKAALQDILNQRAEDAKDKKESLHEKLNINKAIGTINDDEFDDIINGILDKVDAIAPINYSSPRAARVKEIKSDVTSAKTIRDLSAEDKANLAKDIDPAEKARQDEIKKYRIDNLPSTATFKLDLYDAIRDQVDKVKKSADSWGAINKRHAGTDIIKPGTVIRGEWEEKKPIIQVYLDCSSSFSEDDIKQERALMNVLADFEKNDEIEVQIWYFANHLHSTYASARAEGSTSAWNEIMDKVRKTSPANVLVITDSDMDYQGRHCGYYNTDGCVWYIWKEAKAPSLPEHLYGDLGLKEYVIEW